MINYAWANPTTGIREQAASAAEARFHAFEALERHKQTRGTLPFHLVVYEQEIAGRVTRSTDMLFEPEAWQAGYAWANPNTGQRDTTETWKIAVEDIQLVWPADAPIDFVTVYRQRFAFNVDLDDRRPEAPAPAEIPPDSPASLIQAVMEGTCADLGRAQLLAMLWIAEALRRRVPNPPRYNRRRIHRARRRGRGMMAKLWRRVRHVFGFGTGPGTGQAFCRECGEQLADPDGIVCAECARLLLAEWGTAPRTHLEAVPPRGTRLHNSTVNLDSPEEKEPPRGDN